MPFKRPLSEAVCEVPPVVGNTAFEAKGVFAVVLYAQLASSSVVSESAAAVVPAGSVPEGALFEMCGGVTSGGSGGGTELIVTACVIEPPGP